MSDDLIEPSDAEQAEWPQATEAYVRGIEVRIEELEEKLDWVIVERDETFALMLHRAQTAETKLAKAVEYISKDAARIEHVVSKIQFRSGHDSMATQTWVNGWLYEASSIIAGLTGGKDE